MAVLDIKGLSREQVAGIMGNLMQEHGFNTSGDGLAQWTGSRKANLMSRENPYTIQTQLEFLWYELSGGYVKVLNNIRATSDTAEATRIFQNQFERCGQCAETLRINYALSILGATDAQQITWPALATRQTSTRTYSRHGRNW